MFGHLLEVGPIFLDFPPANVMVSDILSGTFTVTLHFALTPEPSFAVTLISAVPFATAVTVPFAFTVATLAFELLQVMFLFAALSGVTVAVRLAVWPFEVSVKDDWLNVMLETLTGFGVAVGAGVAVGLGVAVGTGVAVGFGVAVGCGAFVGCGAAVGFGVSVGFGIAVGFGIGVAVGFAG